MLFLKVVIFLLDHLNQKKISEAFVKPNFINCDKDYVSSKNKEGKIPLIFCLKKFVWENCGQMGDCSFKALWKSNLTTVR